MTSEKTQLPFKQNDSGNFVERDKNRLTDSRENMGLVDHSKFSGNVVKDREEHEITMISFIEKRPKLRLWGEDIDLVDSHRHKHGDARTMRLLEIGRSREKLFRSETSMVRMLNEKGNPHVPRIVDYKENYYKMVFVNGIKGEDVYGLKLNTPTNLNIAKKTLHAARDVFLDGVVNLEYDPKNIIVVPNLNSGKAEAVKLIDFGVSFQVDEDGDMEVDMNLFGELTPDIFPQEIRFKEGIIKVNAEKCLVWSLANRVVLTWLKRTNIKKLSTIQRALSSNPEERCSLDELISFIDNLNSDEEQITSCIPEKTLKENREMLGKSDSEVMISEKEMERIVKEISAIKAKDADDEKEKKEALRVEKEKDIKVALQLARIANEFINSKRETYTLYDIIPQIERGLVVEIEVLYEELKSRIDFASIRTIMDSVADIAVLGDDALQPPIENIFPKFYRQNPELGMHSMLASSILRLAIEEKMKMGNDDEAVEDESVQTLFFDGYHVIFTSLDKDNEMVIIDPLALSLGEDGEDHCFVLSFNDDQIVNSQSIYTPGFGATGSTFRIEVKEKPYNRNIFTLFDAEKGVPEFAHEVQHFVNF